MPNNKKPPSETPQQPSGRRAAQLRAFFYLWAGLIVALDQISKILVERLLNYGEPLFLLTIFDLRLQYNTGAAFSLLSDAGGWQRWLLTGLSATISAVLAVWLWRLAERREMLLSTALVLVFGGAIGNLIDRIRLGYVIDFISLHFRDYYYPTFNVADMAITLGGILLLMQIWRDSKGTDKP